MTFYLRNEAESLQSDVVTANGIFALSPVDELIIGVNAARTKTNAAAINQAPSQNLATVQPPGSSTIGTIGVSEGYSHQYTKNWRGFQGIDAGLMVPIDTPVPQANRYTLAPQFGAEYVDDPNAYALILRGTYFFTPRVDSDNQQISPREEDIILGTTARWRRDLGRDYSSELALGMVRASRLDTLGKGYYAATGSAAIRYVEERGTAELMVARDVAPNLLMGQVYLYDRAQLQGGIPLSRNLHLFTNAALGASMNSIINVDDGHTQGTAKAYLIDAALSWVPPNIGVYSSIRYQHMQQRGNDSDEVPLPTFSRNMIMLTVGGIFPAREVPRIPNATGGRVDGTDRPANMRETDFRDRRSNQEGAGG
jgi:hypothetical protein